jgi:hypothetical protein
VGGGRAKAVEPIRPVGRRIEHGDQQAVSSKSRAIAHQEIAGEPEASRADVHHAVAAREQDHDGARGGSRADEEERLGDAGTAGDGTHLVG